MRMGQVIGRVTLATAEPSYRGGRFLVVQPLSREQLAGAPLTPLAKGNSLVVYDRLGASVGDRIGYSDGAEASMPFSQPTPCDAYNCCLLDAIFYQPPTPPAQV